MRPQVTTSHTRPSRRVFLALAGLAVVGVAAVALPKAFAQSSTGQDVQKMDADKAYEAARAGEIILVDIRTPEEWQQTGIGEGAIALDMRAPDFVQKLVALRQKYEDKPIALICRTGNRSGYVFEQLNAQGFPGLADVAEGMAGGPNGPGWIKRGLPVYPGNKAEIETRLKAVLGD